MILAICASVFLVGFLSFILKYLWQPNHNGRTIPGPRGWPLVGLALEIKQNNVYEKFSSFAGRFGDIFVVKIFNKEMISLNSADLIRKAFSEAPYKTIMNDRSYIFVADYILQGAQSISVFRKGHDPVHNDLRKGMTKALHVYGDGVKEFEGKILTELTRVVKLIDDFEGHEFEFETVIKRSLSNVISLLLIGEQIDDIDEQLIWEYDKGVDALINPTTDAILSTFPFLRNCPGPFRPQYQRILDAKAKLVAKFVDKQKETYQPGRVRGIIDSLFQQQMADIQAGREVTYTHHRIVCAALETIAAGILSTLSTLCSSMICLLNHPDYQRKVQEELDSVVGRERMPQLTDRGNCPLLEAVIMESVRVITPVPFLLPHLCGEDVVFEGYNVKKNSLIVPNVYYVHHDEKVWGNPWTFRPERFLGEDGQLLPRGHDFMKSWLPFGIGRRQCIGESLARSRVFLYMATLLQRWSFVPTPGKYRTWDSRQKEDFSTNLTVRPKPFYCRAVRRQT